MGSSDFCLPASRTCRLRRWLNPGPGSVIYRGLAAVNIGGVVVSLIFSLVLIPALMRLLQPARARAPGSNLAPAPLVHS